MPILMHHQQGLLKGGLNQSLSSNESEIANTSLDVK